MTSSAPSVIPADDKRWSPPRWLYGLIGAPVLLGAIFIILRLLFDIPLFPGQEPITTPADDAIAAVSTPNSANTPTNEATPSPEPSTTTTALQPTATEQPLTASSDASTHILVATSSSSSPVTLSAITPEVTPTADPTQLFALAPEIEFTLFSDSEASSPSIRMLKPLERIRVIDIDEEWAKVETEDGQTGWIRSPFYIYEGNGSRLPPDLHIRLVSNRNDLPFIYAEVISYGGATGDYLLRDPHNELSGFHFIAVGTHVTILQIGEGAKTYESGQWCFVSLQDPQNPSQLVTGWLPLDILKERKSPYE